MDPTIEGQIDASTSRIGQLWDWLRDRCRRWFTDRQSTSGARNAATLADPGPPGPEPARRLLFLDDDPLRAKVFLRENPEAVWVTTVADCIEQLQHPWDEVHLDHDLGGRTFVDSEDQDCGMEVIRWLCKEPRPHLKDARFFVHTHHAAAGLLMVLEMHGKGYMTEFRPFGLDLARLLAHNDRPSDDPSGLSPDVEEDHPRSPAARRQDQRDAEIQPPPSTRSS